MFSDEEHIKRLKSQVTSGERMLRDAVLQREALNGRVARLEAQLRAVNVNPDAAIVAQISEEGRVEQARIHAEEKAALQAEVSTREAARAEARGVLVQVQQSLDKAANTEKELRAALAKALSGWKVDKTQLELTEDALVKVKAQRDALSQKNAAASTGVGEVRQELERFQREVDSLKDDARQSIEEQRKLTEENGRLTRLLRVANDQTRTDRTSLEQIGKELVRVQEEPNALRAELVKKDAQIAAGQVKERALQVKLDEAKGAAKVVETPLAAPAAVSATTAVPPKFEIRAGMRLRGTNSKKQREVWLVERVDGTTAHVSIEGKPNSSCWKPCVVLAQLALLPT